MPEEIAPDCTAESCAAVRAHGAEPPCPARPGNDGGIKAAITEAGLTPWKPASI